MDNKNNWRIENKFILNEYNIEQIKYFIKKHPSFFKKQHQTRQVNNIYFDDHKYSSFYDNIEGYSKREKVRIRWYGDTFKKIKKPILEIKIKNSQLGYKEYVKLNDFNFHQEIFDNNFFINIFKNISEKYFYNKIYKKKPVLVNSYNRQYYVSINKKIRITLDSKLKFYNIKKNFVEINDDKKILEIKYDLKNHSDARHVSQYFPFRTSKSSKYVIGVNLLNTSPSLYE